MHARYFKFHIYTGGEKSYVSKISFNNRGNKTLLFGILTVSHNYSSYLVFEIYIVDWILILYNNTLIRNKDAGETNVIRHKFYIQGLSRSEYK